MPKASHLFRESALERLSSPDQLDQLLRVTRPRGWVSLVALWGLLGAVVAWAFFGSVPTRVEGRGILVAGGGLQTVVAPGTGRIRSIGVSVGDVIEPGQVIAEINQFDLRDKLQEAKSELNDLIEEQKRLSALDEKEEEDFRRVADQRIDSFRVVIDNSKARIEILQVSVANMKTSVQEGLKLPIDLILLEKDLAEAITTRDLAKVQIEEIKAENTKQAARLNREQEFRRVKIEKQQRQIATLQNSLQRESKVQSDISGRVLEIRASIRQAVNEGDTILLIEPSESESNTLSAILYVSATTGKDIREDMPVQINPSTVRYEDYGSLEGIVESISLSPLSKDAMRAVLKDDDLVEAFSREFGLVLEMRVNLLTAETQSGYQWTTVLGPPNPLTSNTLCTGKVTVREDIPLRLVIPQVRSAVVDE